MDATLLIQLITAIIQSQTKADFNENRLRLRIGKQNGYELWIRKTTNRLQNEQHTIWLPNVLVLHSHAQSTSNTWYTSFKWILLTMFLFVADTWIIELFGEWFKYLDRNMNKKGPCILCLRNCFFLVFWNGKKIEYHSLLRSFDKQMSSTCDTKQTVNLLRFSHKSPMGELILRAPLYCLLIHYK